jgi:hypothetical protein
VLAIAAVVSACWSEELSSPRKVATESSNGILDGVLAPPPIGAKADPGTSIRLAYALADQPALPLYTPVNYYSYAGGGIRVKRIGVGHYAVEFDRLSNVFWGGTENVITTAVGYSRLQCTPDFWFSSATEDKLSVRVDCIEMATGLHQDSPFSILVVGSGSLPAPSAFAIASQPSTASYTPDPAYSNSSGTVAKLITHNALPGDWNVQLGTGSPAGSTYLVSSRELQRACNVAEWKSFGARVRCFDGTGTAVDGTYDVLQIGRGRPGRRFGFAWANLPTTQSYMPNPSYSYNSSGGAVRVERVSWGQYVVSFEGLHRPWDDLPHSENVQVTTFGTTYASCNTSTWYDDADWLVVWVFCLDRQSNQIDTRFNVMVIE